MGSNDSASATLAGTVWGINFLSRDSYRSLVVLLPR